MKPPAPQSYDEITRRTVIEPDLAFRPPPDHSRDTAPREVYEQVADALLAIGHTDVGFEVAHGKVILRGHLRDQAAIDRVVKVVRSIAGVEIDNRLITASRRW